MMVFARTVAEAFLEPHVVDVFPTVSEAINASGRHEYDVVLVDFDLHDRKGDELVRYLRAEGSSMLVVGVSAHATVCSRRTRRPAPRSFRGPPRASRASRCNWASRLDVAPNERVTTPERAFRHPWAWLLARVFAVDVMVFPHCAGAMRLVKIATTRDEIARALASAGLGPRPPPRPRPALLGPLEMNLGDT